MELSVEDLVSLLGELTGQNGKKLGCAWRVAVVDGDGNVSNVINGENSILTNYAMLMKANFINDGVSITCTDGTARTLGICYYCENDEGSHGYGYTNYTSYADNYAGILSNAPEGDDTYGIVVGTGTTAVTAADYALDTQIATGTGTGQMNYKETIVADVSVVGTQVKQSIVRTFENVSGATISIEEIGLVAKVKESAATYDWYYVQMIKDLVGTAIDVPDGSSAIIEYLLYTEL